MSGTAQQIALSATWPLPQASDISSVYEQSYLQAFPGCQPTRANSFMAVQARTHGIVGFNLYLYQRSLADELMADTAIAWLPRHGAQWAVPQLPATASIGPVIFAGPANLPIPAGVELVSTDGNGTQFITQAAANTGAGGSVTVQVQCEVTGSVGNIAAAATLDIISPILGLQNQTVTVGAGGLAGGTDPEATEAWRARILLRIQKRGQSGAASDYIEWAEANGAAPTPGVIPSWVGPGSVGLVFALPNPAGPDRLVPTGAQVAAMQAALDQVRPVTAQVVALAAVQTPVPVTLALATDSVTNRALAQSAADAFIAGVAIGGLLDRSELEDAVLQACGCGVEISVPAANVQAAPTQMLALAAPPTFVSYV